MPNRALIYKYKDLLQIVWIAIAIALIILITPMKATDQVMRIDIDINTESINTIKTNQAVLRNNCESLYDVMEKMQKDIRFLVLERGGTPSK